MSDMDNLWEELEAFVAYNRSLVTSKMMICRKMQNMTKDSKILSNIELEYDLLYLWHKIFWIFELINERRSLSQKQENISKFQGEVNTFIGKYREDHSYILNRCSVSKRQIG